MFGGKLRLPAEAFWGEQKLMRGDATFSQQVIVGLTGSGENLEPRDFGVWGNFPDGVVQRFSRRLLLPLRLRPVSLAIGGLRAGHMVECIPDGGHIVQTIVGIFLGGDVEECKYAICVIPGHVFCCDSFSCAAQPTIKPE